MHTPRSPHVWGAGWGQGAGGEENHRPGIRVLFPKVKYLVPGLTLTSTSSLSLEKSFHLLRFYFALRQWRFRMPGPYRLL